VRRGRRRGATPPRRERTRERARARVPLASISAPTRRRAFRRRENSSSFRRRSLFSRDEPRRAETEVSRLTLSFVVSVHDSYGRRLDYYEKKRKKEAREPHKRSAVAKKLIGLKAKLYAKKRHSEKVTMKKTIQQHSERTNKHKVEEEAAPGAIPAYLLDREQTSRAKVLSNTIKQKRKDKAGKWEVPLPKVRPVAEDEMFRVMRSGKRQKKTWKRMITKATFVGPGFTRKPPKYERFIRPSGLRFTKAHVTHPELKCTFQLDILGVKKNPNGPMYSSLGVLTKGTVIEVNVSELGLVTPGGKVVWGKYAQVTNNPENDGCVNGVLLV
jgi:ribosome biogenesis protein NSA2